MTPKQAQQAAEEIRQRQQHLIDTCGVLTFPPLTPRSDMVAIILRALDGSDEYRRGVLDAAKVADERVEFWDKGKNHMVGILLITEAQQCATAIRSLLTTEQGVSGRDWQPIETAPTDVLIRIKEQATNWVGTGIRKVYTDADNHTESYCQVLHYNGEVLVKAFYATHWKPI